MADGGPFSPIAWMQLEPPGAECANGTPYKVFVDLRPTSKDVIFFFEGGGACWDYESCTGSVRSASNRDGLADNYANMVTRLDGIAIPVDAIYPLLSRDPSVSPVADWNKVFLPYCTGDIFSGSSPSRYSDPDGLEEDLLFRHVGHRNIQRTLEVVAPMLSGSDQLLVSGCSAGGAGATLNYASVRNAVAPTRSYLVADSGPIFPDQASTARSLPLHNQVLDSWDLAPLIETFASPAEVRSDFGAVNTQLADAFPADRLAVSFFQLDYDYSLYSYERFYQAASGGGFELLPPGAGPVGLDESDPNDRALVYQLWADDTGLLVDQFDQRSNLAYFLPYYRNTNSSHCTSVTGFGEFERDEILARLVSEGLVNIAWEGTELVSSGGEIDFRDFVIEVLDDESPLTSYFETSPEGPFIACAPGQLDPAACKQAALEP